MQWLVLSEGLTVTVKRKLISMWRRDKTFKMADVIITQNGGKLKVQDGVA